MLGRIACCARCVGFVVFAAGLQFAAVGALAAERAYEFRVADLYAVSHTISVGGIQYFMRTVTERTDGRVRFQYFPSEQLAKGSDIPDAIRAGIADIGNILYIGNLNALLYVVQLPGLYDDTQVVEASVALWNFVNKNQVIRETLRKLNLRPLFCATTSAYQVVTPRPNVNSLGALKGMKVMANGVVLPLSVRAVGMVPVVINPNEAYDALTRGVLDGVSIGVPSVKAYSFYEIARSAVINLDLGGFPVCYAMNSNTWGTLPEDVRAVMAGVGQETTVNLARYYMESVDRDLAEWQKRGIALYRLSREEQREKVLLLSSVERSWRDALESRGVPGAAEAIAQWKEELAAQLAAPR